MRLSRRTGWDRRPNSLAEAVERRRGAGAALLDLTEANPTRVGLAYPEAQVLEALADPAALHYAPDPRGLPAARTALASWLSTRGLRVAADDLVLTASTSEAYAFLFKLLCDPGDQVLVPRPSYPLFELLSTLEGIQPVPYELAFDGSWRLDVHAVEEAVTPSTRAVLIIHPHHPAGAFLEADELSRLSALCRHRGLPLVSDEVFLEYAFDPAPHRCQSVLARDPDVLTFSLGGLSKSAGLPQLKLGWIAVGGPEADRAEALARLELVADSYLSVASPVQHGLARLLSLGEQVRDRIRDRVRQNRALLASLHPAGAPWSLLPAEGGWSAVLRIPGGWGEEETCLALLEQGVLVQPGYFYDFPRGHHLVLSLLPPPHDFREGIGRLVRAFDETAPLGR